MSGVPPGGKVTITRTGFDGKPCAHAADERTASTASAMIVLRNIYDPPRDLGLADGERIAPNTTPPAARAPLLKKGGDRKEKGGPFSSGAASEGRTNQETIGWSAVPMRCICAPVIMPPRIFWKRSSCTPETMYCQR